MEQELKENTARIIKEKEEQLLSRLFKRKINAESAELFTQRPQREF